MNILYVSNMDADMDSGPYWSVPNQVVSQSKFDNVFWYNNCSATCKDWENTGFYHSHIDYPSKQISDFPAPFNKPDLVIFEGFYVKIYDFYNQVRKSKIPYIIVPRGALTTGSQQKHRWKKVIGNALFFKRFTRNARAIHFLTQAELDDSGFSWNRNYFVASNGVISFSNKQWRQKKYEKNEHLKGIFIGRISVFHKGLDLLLRAVSEIQDDLRNAGLTIDIFGPDREHQRNELQANIIERSIQDILILHDNPIFGRDKEQLLLNADFFVLTSRLEGHPMGLIEALSYGLPSLITRGSNMFNEIKEFECGWISETNVQGIKESLVTLIKTPKEKLKEMSVNAIHLAKQYKWDSIAANTHKKYIQLLS